MSKIYGLLHVKTGEEAIIITRFGTCVHSDTDVPLLHPTPVPFSLWKGLSGAKESLDCLFSYFLPKEAASRLLGMLVPDVQVEAGTLMAIKI